MPTYDYRCTKCKHVFELFHSITDDSPKCCPRCNSRAIRIPSSGGGLIFKGTGFYITDYRSKSYRDKAKQEKPASESTPSKESTPSRSRRRPRSRRARRRRAASRSPTGRAAAASPARRPTDGGDERAAQPHPADRRGARARCARRPHDRARTGRLVDPARPRRLRSRLG